MSEEEYNPEEYLDLTQNTSKKIMIWDEAKEEQERQEEVRKQDIEKINKQLNRDFDIGHIIVKPKELPKENITPEITNRNLSNQSETYPEQQIIKKTNNSTPKQKLWLWSKRVLSFLGGILVVEGLAFLYLILKYDIQVNLTPLA